MGRRKESGILKDYLIAVTIAVVVALLIRFFLIEAYRIPSHAMRPALESGDTIFVLKSAYNVRMPFSAEPLIRIAPPSRGDVVVFATPTDPDYDYIKRIVALPGDTVQVRNGHVILNGKPLSADPLSSNPCGMQTLPAGPTHLICWEPPSVADFGPTKVPEQSVFVIGDMRSDIRAASSTSLGLSSADSAKFRSWGIIPIVSLKGKALWVWLSVEPGSASRGSWFPQIRFERMLRRIQ